MKIKHGNCHIKNKHGELWKFHLIKWKKYYSGMSHEIRFFTSINCNRPFSPLEKQRLGGTIIKWYFYKTLLCIYSNSHYLLTCLENVLHSNGSKIMSPSLRTYQLLSFRIISFFSNITISLQRIKTQIKIQMTKKKWVFYFSARLMPEKVQRKLGRSRIVVRRFLKRKKRIGNRNLLPAAP